MFVVILSPDGGGKTAVARGLTGCLGKLQANQIPLLAACGPS